MLHNQASHLVASLRIKIFNGGPGAAQALLCRAGPKLGSLSRVNAVLANDVGELRQEFPELGVLLDQRMGFVGRFVAAKGGLIASQGVLKQ
jgi:hypothetical protein